MKVHHQQFCGVQVFGGKPEDQLRQHAVLLFQISDMGRLDEVIVQSVRKERVR